MLRFNFLGLIWVSFCTAYIWSDVRSSNLSGEAFDIDPENPPLSNIWSRDFILSLIFYSVWLLSSRLILLSQSFETFGFSFRLRLYPQLLWVFGGGCFKLSSSFLAKSAICLSSAWMSWSVSGLSSKQLLDPLVELNSELGFFYLSSIWVLLSFLTWGSVEIS